MGQLYQALGAVGSASLVTGQKFSSSRTHVLDGRFPSSASSNPFGTKRKAGGGHASRERSYLAGDGTGVAD